MFECPSIDWTLRKSAPLTSRSVAKEWRKVCGVIDLVIPASRPYFATDRWMERVVRRV